MSDTKSKMTLGYRLGVALQVGFWTTLLLGILVALAFRVPVTPFRYMGF